MQGWPNCSNCAFNNKVHDTIWCHSAYFACYVKLHNFESSTVNPLRQKYNFISGVYCKFNFTVYAIDEIISIKLLQTFL